MNIYSINDTVEIIESPESQSAAKNLVGVIVAIFDGSPKYYEVEITDSDGRTIDTLTLPENLIHKI